jgi:hypothetical protein
MATVSSGVRDRLRIAARDLLLRALARVMRVAHPVNASGNNRSMR